MLLVVSGSRTKRWIRGAGVASTLEKSSAAPASAYFMMMITTIVCNRSLRRLEEVKKE